MDNNQVRTVNAERYFGTVASTNLDRGFFFIRYYLGKESSDIFAHVSQVLPGSPRPRVGYRCMFAIGIDPFKHREQAVQVQLFAE